MRNYNSVGCNYLFQISACQMTLSRRLRAITELRVSSPRRVRRGQLLWGEQTICSLPVTWGHLSGVRGPQMFQTCKAGSIIGFLFSSTIDFCCRDDLFLQGGLSKLQLGTKKAEYRAVETAQGIIYIWSGNWWHNTAYCDRHAAAGGYGWCVLCNPRRLDNICGREALVKFDFLWWCFMVLHGWVLRLQSREGLHGTRITVSSGMSQGHLAHVSGY